MTHLRQAPVGLDGAAAEAAEAVTEQLVVLLRTLRDRIDVLDDRIGEALQLHADAHIFRSLPRAGTVRAALLLAEIGDCRGRFPTEEALAAAAGVSPSTRASGRSHAVVFRHACDNRLREALIDFAADSRQASPGPRTSTTGPAPAAPAIHTPFASSPEPGSGGSGAAGPTTPPTTPPGTADSSSSRINPPLDMGLSVGLPDAPDGFVNQAYPVVEDREDRRTVGLRVGVGVIGGFDCQHGGVAHEDLVAAAGVVRGFARGGTRGAWGRTSSWLFDNEGASSIHICPAWFVGGGTPNEAHGGSVSGLLSPGMAGRFRFIMACSGGT
jgi:hypothetical protein